jgi:hypothetical protein
MDRRSAVAVPVIKSGLPHSVARRLRQRHVHRRERIHRRASSITSGLARSPRSPSRRIPASVASTPQRRRRTRRSARFRATARRSPPPGSARSRGRPPRPSPSSSPSTADPRAGLSGFPEEPPSVVRKFLLLIPNDGWRISRWWKRAVAGRRRVSTIFPAGRREGHGSHVVHGSHLARGPPNRVSRTSRAPRAGFRASWGLTTGKPRLLPGEPVATGERAAGGW